MEKTWIIVLAISLFLIITFIFWRLTIGRFKKEYGKKERKLWGASTFYWQSVIYICTGITFLVLALLKWTNIFNF